LILTIDKTENFEHKFVMKIKVFVVSVEIWQQKNLKTNYLKSL
jgi:hypothetical protein